MTVVNPTLLVTWSAVVTVLHSAGLLSEHRMVRHRIARRVNAGRMAFLPVGSPMRPVMSPIRKITAPIAVNPASTNRIDWMKPKFPPAEKALPAPRTITATVAPAGEASIDITSLAHEDHTGELDVVAHVDIDDSHATALEDVNVVSRWRATGAGRADIGIAGGDLPAAGLEGVTAVECWGSDFMRSYYSDSINFEPTEGEAALLSRPCAETE